VDSTQYRCHKPQEIKQTEEKLEKEAFTLKAKEKEENTVRNIRSAGDHSSHEAKVFQFRQNKRQCREDNVWGGSCT
jgi:hypothetical protein